MRQRGDHHFAVLFFPHCALTHRSAAALVDLADLGARGDDFRFGREIRPLYDIEQIVQRGFRIIDQRDGRLRHFAQVVRRNVGRHADGDAGGAVQQNIRQARRQHLRLVQRAVEVRHEIDRALPQLAQQHFGVARQARFGITHGGERFRIVRRAPVPLTIHQRIAVGERLRHQHHRFVAGAVAVGMIFTQHVADGARRFLEFRAGVQPQLRHRIDNAALDRLQAIANIGKRPVHDDVHGIVQVRILGKFMQGKTLCTILRQVTHYDSSRCGGRQRAAGRSVWRG